MAEIGETTDKCIGLQVELQRSSCEQFFLFRSKRLNTAALASVEQRFAKKFPISGVNQRVRGKNLREFWKRLSGGKQKAAAPELIALRLETRLSGLDRSISEISCLGAGA